VAGTSEWRCHKHRVRVDGTSLPPAPSAFWSASAHARLRLGHGVAQVALSALKPFPASATTSRDAIGSDLVGSTITDW
jgi:hypothetical protein